MEAAFAKNGSVIHTNASENLTYVILYSPAMYYSIGSLMTFIMVIGFSTNLAILYTYITNRKIRTVDNTLIIGLALSDIGQAIFGIPFVAISSFSKHWVFGHAFCQYYAFITTMFGIAQICMLSVIAVERYFVIVRRDRRLTNTTCRCIVVIMFSFIYGSSWATGPLVGWSGYKEEEIGIACCVKWEIKDKNAFSYTISLCTFGWLIPLFLIAFGYISIACTIHKEGNKKIHLRRKLTPNKASREQKVAITVLIMIGAFFISWTPYSVVSLWSAVGNFHSIPLWAQVAPAVFAKCSIIWNPLIYVARHKHFRQGVKQSLTNLKFWKREISRLDSVAVNKPYSREKQIYKTIETCSQKDSLNQSNVERFVSHIGSPSKSQTSTSSVFMKEPFDFNRHRLKRHLTFMSSMGSSQQIIEQSEADSSDLVKNFRQGDEKYTQTDYVCVQIPFILSKQLTDRYVQTDLSCYITGKKNLASTKNTFFNIKTGDIQTEHLNGITVDSESEVTDTLDNQIPIHQKDNSKLESGTGKQTFTPKQREDGEYCESIVLLDDKQTKHEKEETSSPIKYYEVKPFIGLSNECRNDRKKRLLQYSQTTSLTALKEKRKLLRHQLERIYCDKCQCNIRYSGNEERKLRETKVAIESQRNTLQKQLSKRIRNDMLSSKSMDVGKGDNYAFDMTSTHGRYLTKLSRRNISQNRHLKPYYLQKYERYKEKTTRERIISDPTSIEMKSYTFETKTFPKVNELNVHQDDEGACYHTGDRSMIIRQSTV